MPKSPFISEHIKKLNWAIWMSQVNLDTLREGDWLNLKQDLYGFMEFTPPEVIARLREPVLPTQVLHRNPSFGFPQEPDNLALAESLLHVRSPFRVRSNSKPACYSNRGRRRRSAMASWSPTSRATPAHRREARPAALALCGHRPVFLRQ